MFFLQKISLIILEKLQVKKKKFMISGEVLNAQKCFFAAPQKIGMA
jgi:hypothetical protein